MERKFIKSGIPGLDDVLGGGLLEGSVVTVSGPTGAGKSTLAAQFLHNGAVDSNEPGLYISIEESRRDFFFHLGGFEWDFQALERDRKFILLDYPIHEVDQIVTQSSAIQEIIATTGTKRVVIDSIMPIALYFKGDDERKKGFLKFIENLRKWNTTTLIVSEDLKMGHAGSRPSSEYGIESFTDGWVNLFFKYDDKALSRARYVEVIKMKGVDHSSRAYPAILNSKGFSIVHEARPAETPKPQAQVHKAAPPPQKPLKTLAPRPEPEERGEPAPAEEKPKPKPAKAPPKPAAKPARPAPAKMSPTLAARLAEAKSKIMKKK
ncbi:MAG: ATPase domain-containing protein [Candidatus Micrarchaeota archaeon]